MTERSGSSSGALTPQAERLRQKAMQLACQAFPESAGRRERAIDLALKVLDEALDAERAACAALVEPRRREADAMQAGYKAGLAKSIVGGYDAQFWHDSYTLLREAIIEHLDDCIREDDVAEEAILVEAIETAAKRLKEAALVVRSPARTPQEKPKSDDKGS